MISLNKSALLTRMSVSAAEVQFSFLVSSYLDGVDEVVDLAECSCDGGSHTACVSRVHEHVMHVRLWGGGNRLNSRALRKTADVAYSWTSFVVVQRTDGPQTTK